MSTDQRGQTFFDTMLVKVPNLQRTLAWNTFVTQRVPSAVWEYDYEKCKQAALEGNRIARAQWNDWMVRWATIRMTS